MEILLRNRPAAFGHKRIYVRSRAMSDINSVLAMRRSPYTDVRETPPKRGFKLPQIELNLVLVIVIVREF